jgi:UDP-glucose 4-epimerase
MNIEAIADKIVPTIILAIVFAIFGMYTRVGYLEYTAESAINRYVEDKKIIEARVSKLEQRIQEAKEDIIRLQK